MSWTRRKSIEAMTPTGDQHRLARTLSWPHLLALGVATIPAMTAEMEAFIAQSKQAAGTRRAE